MSKENYRGQHFVMVLNNILLCVIRMNIYLAFCLLFCWSLGQPESCIIMAELMTFLVEQTHQGGL